MAEEQVIFRAEVEGQASITDLRKNVRGMRAEWNGFTEDQRKARQDVALAIKSTQDYIHKASKPLLSAKALERESYFKVGEELRRRSLPLMSSMSNTLSSMPRGIDGVVRGLDNLVISFAQVSASAGGSKNAIKSMLSQMLGIGGIGLAVAAVGALVKMFVDAKEAARESAEEIKKHIKALADLQLEIDKIRGKTGVDFSEAAEKEAQSAVLLAERNRILADIEERRKKVELRQPGRGDRVKATEEEAKRLREIALELQTIEKDLAQTDKDRIAANEKAYEDRVANEVQILKIMREQTAEANKLPLRQRAFSPDATIFPQVGTGTGLSNDPTIKKTDMIVNKVKEVPKHLQGMEVSFTAAERLSISMSQTLKSGAQGFATTFVNALIQGRDIAQSLLAMLVQFGVQTLVSSIFPFDKGGLITEPVVGRGTRSGSIYTFAEKGPEYVVPNDRTQMMMQPTVQVVPIITSSGLAVQVEIGNRINRQRRI